MRQRRSLVWSTVIAVVAAAATIPAQQDHGLGRRSPQAVANDAARIDALIDADLAAHGQKPVAAIDDATLVRRLYLDVIGRIPTADEAAAYLRAPSAQRRAALIDTLLASPGHDSHVFHWWADLLRAKSRLVQQISGEPYLHWLKQSLAAAKPYDQMVRELLTAEGAVHARGNGATGYYLRDRGMPLDNMANTVRVFLGTRLECAQCHNHPFDRWTQKQFYAMAAFTGGMRYEDGEVRDSAAGRRLVALGRQLGKDDPKAASALRRMLRTYAAGVDGSGSGRIRLPPEYKYDDAAPGDLVEAQTIFGGALPLQLPALPARRAPPRAARRPGRDEQFPEAATRTAFADWLTAPENPRFTAVIVNRMLLRLFGRSLIEPCDGITDQTVPSHPELQALLERLMIEVGFDLRQFERVLLNTAAYRRAACVAADGEVALQSPVLRRLSAEQMWDSLLTLVVEDLDCTLQPPGALAEPVYTSHAEIEQLAEADLRDRIDREALRDTDPARYRALLLQERRARAEVQRRRSGALLRASDLPSPAPAGHPLRQFGQSDREQIEATSVEANVPQVLTMLNGFVDQYIARPDTVVMRALAAAPTAADKVRAAFRAVLGRAPSAAELVLWQRDVARDEASALRDLIWTLVNTNEFRFVR